MMRRRNSLLIGHKNFQRKHPVSLIVHMNQLPSHADALQLVEIAVHHYFGRCAKLNRLEFRYLLKEGTGGLF